MNFRKFPRCILEPGEKNSELINRLTLIEKDHLGDRSPEKDCC